MKISVIGCGRWGSFIGYYVNKLGHETIIYGREQSKNLKRLQKTSKNDYISLDKSITLTSELSFAISSSEVIAISINSQQLRNVAKQLAKVEYQNKIFVLCMKGIEQDTGKRLTTIMKEELGESTQVAIWVGPGHVEDFAKGIPNCMVIDCDNDIIKKKLVKELSSKLIRFYYGHDLIGNEIGAAAKNVIGIAAGLLDGLNFSSLKGALMARGAREVSRLIEAMGGHKVTAYGLSHLGDYQATLFSPFSHNRRYGQALVTKEDYKQLAEGVKTVKALTLLGKKYGVDLPISQAVYEIIYEQCDVKETLLTLFERPVKFEFKN
ncbi:MAG: NAD(P)H-dependent glycerol-3-phosphate dehydrogenase [Clostridiales bacterium]|nr:NAD(P)H-dependent glycerol-3-phosphate dehydrogenase [Clostridiales bacterium]